MQVGAWDWDKIADNWTDTVWINEWFDADLLKDWGRDYSNLAAFLGAEDVPDFQPTDADGQPRLDQKSPVTCPHCGEEFIPA
jgi:hypothetical protein